MDTAKLDAFLLKVKAGQMPIASGGIAKGGESLVETAQTLPKNDAEAVTAEAYNQDVLDVDAIAWPDSVALVKRKLQQTG